MPTINLTEKAAGAVKKIMEDTLQSETARAEQNGGGTATAVKKLYLRVRVVGGGCSGFQNKLDLDPNYNPKNDDVMEQHGVKLVADRKSLLYVSGATVDFHNDLNKRGFSVSNPNAKTTCGCGSSFSV